MGPGRASRVGEAIRFRAGAARDRALDALGRREDLTPPRRLLTGDYSEFRRIGEEFRGHLVELAGLRRDGAVLDVGCGPGRMAVPLTEYLGPGGRYEGFDVVPREVRWCQEHITPRHPNFRFRRVDVRNEHYNPGGAVPAAELRFPYDDGEFDVVLLASVFTHMLEPDHDRYVAEVARVLRPGGSCLATYFLLNDDSRRRIGAGESHFAFGGGREGAAHFEDGSDPEAVVAYDEAFVRGAHEGRGLEVASIHPGYWCGREEYLTWQDVLVSRAA